MDGPFIFKHFQLNQAKSAFKLGTDSVVLGCWIPILPYKTILDIGTGTGILSLMMAQRFEQALITSIEIDQASYIEATNNFTHSKWNNRLNCINDDIVEWGKNNADKKFDLIISNPPYFTDQLKNTDKRKMNARHTNSLNAASMREILHQHLSNSGYFVCILPNIEFDIWSYELNSVGVYLQQECSLSGFEDSEVIRKLGVFAKKKTSMYTEKQYLYNNDKSRSEWYKNISSDFYIK